MSNIKISKNFNKTENKIYYLNNQKFIENIKIYNFKYGNSDFGSPIKRESVCSIKSLENIEPQPNKNVFHMLKCACGSIENLLNEY